MAGANDSAAAAGLAFILGFPRSGTTLLGQILASQPGTVVFEEKPLLGRAIADFVLNKEGPARLAAAPPDELEFYRGDFWRRIRATGIATRGKFVVEQTAFNTVYLSVIKRLFPDAPIVFAIRDPRDVVFSCFRRLFGPNQFTVEFRTLESTAALYDKTMRYAETCRETLDFHPLGIRNEDLIADFDGETKRLCAHLGLEWAPALRDYQDALGDRILTTFSAAQVRRGVSGEGIGQWRRYRAEMEPVLPLLRPWVERFGYPPD